MSKKAYIILFASTLILSASLLLLHLGAGAFVDYDEASYASIIDSTLDSHDISVPLMGESPSFEKPPLYYWLAMASKALGGNNEFAYRLPAVIAGLLSIALVMLIVLELTKDFSISIFGGLMMLTSGIYFEAARQVRLDVPVTACILLSVLCFLKGSKDPRWYIGIGIGLGLGMMFKGVIGMLVVPIILIWALCSREWRWVRSGYFWTGIGLSAAISVPWHWRETALFGRAFWDQYIGMNVIHRLNNNFMNTRGSAYEYFLELVWTTLPWGLPFIASIAWSVRRAALSGWNIRINALIPSIFSALFVIILFLASRTTLLYYFLPAIPFMVISVALFVSEILKSPGVDWKAVLGFCSFFMAIAFFMMVYFGYDNYGPLHLWPSVAKEERDIGRMIALSSTGSFYVYKYPFAETLRYYSGRKEMFQLNDEAIAKTSIPLVLPIEFYDPAILPAGLFDRAALMYRGQFAVLVMVR